MVVKPAARRLIVPGIIERVPQVCEFVVSAAEDAGLNEQSVYHCQIAVDEWCTNIVEHGFNETGRRGRIEVNCRHEGSQFIIVIVDDSPPFDPTSLKEVDTSTSLEAREPGGLGWFFIRKVMDQVHYELKNGRNTLTIIKAGASENQNTAGAMFPIAQLNDDIWVISLNGRLDSANSRQVEAELMQHIHMGRIRLVIDLAEVKYISSSGLKLLLLVYRQVEKAGGRLVLSSLSPRVLEVFEISGFDTLFKITADVASATDMFRSTSQ